MRLMAKPWLSNFSKARAEWYTFWPSSLSHRAANIDTYQSNFPTTVRPLRLNSPEMGVKDAGVEKGLRDQLLETRTRPPLPIEDSGVGARPVLLGTATDGAGERLGIPAPRLKARLFQRPVEYCQVEYCQGGSEWHGK